MKFFYWLVALAAVYLVVDEIQAHVRDHLKARKRKAEMERFNMGAFRGTKQNDWWAQ